jgi:hypothetical protein
MIMRRFILTNLLVALIILVVGLLIILPGIAKADDIDAVKAELASTSTKAELNAIKYANVPAIEQQIKTAADDWVGAYGDTANTQIYFNLKTLMVEVEQCKQAIRLVAAAINTITDPNDPNSLAARVEVLEREKELCVACITDFGEGGTIGKVDFLVPDDPKCLMTVDAFYTKLLEYKLTALKPDDPNEVK